MTSFGRRRVSFYRSKLWAIGVMIAALSSRADAQSVPGIYGFGTQTRGAYSGSSQPTIYRVENLNDSGPGSLRAAMTASGPRVVIFEVSGTIDLSSYIYVRQSYLTVAGQTAPSPGITLRRYGLVIDANDVLLQHFRVRPGDGTCNGGIEAWGTSAQNIVLDHMSVSWAQDENLIFYNSARPINLTLWRSISAEALHMTPNTSQCGGGGMSRGHGLLIYERTRNVSVLQSLLAHNPERNPSVQGGTTSYIANNLIYDFAEGTILGDPSGVGPLQASVVGNYYRRGPSTPSPAWPTAVRALNGDSRVYVADNARDGQLEDFYVLNGDGTDPRVGSPPVSVPGYSPMSSSAVYDTVLTQAGARPADRDDVDRRIVNEVLSGTGQSYIRTPAQVGGWPSLTVNRRSLTLPSNPHRVTSSGYTELEQWLHAYSAQVEGSGSAPSTPSGGAAPPAVPPASVPSGTRTPPAPSVVDSFSAVWTIGSGGVILRNGEDTGGAGSEILVYQGTVYAHGTTSHWYIWIGYWSYYGPDDPSGGAVASGGSGGSGVSGGGAPAPAGSGAVDDGSAIWTIGPGNQILRNGSWASGGVGSQIVLHQGVIYVLGDDNATWWRWNGGYWSYFGPNPTA
jgi:hypothetical protein